MFLRFQSLVSWRHCSWTHAEAEHHCGEPMVEQRYSPHGGWGAEREKERKDSPCLLWGHVSDDLTSFHWIYLLQVPLLPNSTTDWWLNLEHVGCRISLRPKSNWVTLHFSFSFHSWTLQKYYTCTLSFSFPY